MTVFQKFFMQWQRHTKLSEFNELMIKVEHVDITLKNYLELAGYNKWARAYAPVDRGTVMTSNIAECINACLVEASITYI